MRRAELARLALVAAAAALTFRLGLDLTLDVTDEGQILYPSWLTARGALPYRDYHQLYGPSLFALNGALLHLFGATLWPVRVGLLAAKTAAVVLTYAAARQLAGPALALAVAALATATWALPIWLFNAPYANHYAAAWLLAALWFVQRGIPPFEAVPPFEKGGSGGIFRKSGAAPAGGVVRLVADFPDRSATDSWKIPPDPPFSKGGNPKGGMLLAGICLGIAATFKQTTGVLLFVGLGLGVLIAARRRDPAAARLPGWLATLVCAGFLLGAAALVAVYLRPGPALNGAILAAPLAALFGLAVWRWRGLDRDGAAAALLALAAGLAAPLLLCAALFAAAGGLGDLVWNTLAGLPQLVRWYTPLGWPSGGAAWLLLAALFALGLSMPGARRRLAAGGATAVALGLVIWAQATGRGTGQATFVTAFLPFAAAAAGVWMTAQAGRGAAPLAQPHAGGGAGAESSSAAASLAPATGVAAASLLQLFPAADVWHLFMVLPLSLPLLAGLLARWSGGLPRRAAAAVAALLLLAAPFLAQLWRTRAAAVPAAGLARAAGVRVSEASLRDLPALLTALERFPAERPLFVAANQQLVYLLAGRDSPLARDEYLLYLLYPGSIGTEDVRQLLREDDAVARLAAAQPIVVTVEGRDGERLRAAYPALGRWLDERTRPLQRIGRYAVRDSAPPSGDAARGERGAGSGARP